MAYNRLHMPYTPDGRERERSISQRVSHDLVNTACTVVDELIILFIIGNIGSPGVWEASLLVPVIEVGRWALTKITTK